LFACGPADAAAIPKAHRLWPHLNPGWFYLSGTGLPVVLEKRPVVAVVVRVSVVYKLVTEIKRHLQAVALRGTDYNSVNSLQ